MNDYNIACFLSFCKTLDLDVTAMQFEISRASVINNISRIEKTLGVSLVAFDTAPPTLTYAGQRFAKFFASFVQELSETQKIFSAVPKNETLTVVWSEFVASPTWLTAAVSEFIRTHPDIEVSTQQAAPSKTVELLENGHADIAICSRYLTGCVSTRCRTADLGELPLYLIAAKDGPYADMTLEDFSRYSVPIISSFVCETDEEAVRRRMARLRVRVGLRPRQFIVMDNLDSVYLSVRYGNGFAISPLNSKVRSAGVFQSLELPLSVSLTAARLYDNTRPIAEEFEAFLAERSVDAE